MTDLTQTGALTTEELFRQHAPFVARFLFRLGVSSEHIPDALQEIFLVVHRNGGYRPGVAKPTSYLAGIAVHAAHKQRRRELVERARHSEASADQLASASADPTRALQAQQDLERLQHALDRLPDELRTTLVLVDIEGESCVSAAAALGLPVGTVYSRLHVARKKLQLSLCSVDAAPERARVARPVPSERRRALRVPSLGMLMLFGLDPSFQRSEAARLLRVAREQPLPAYPVDEQLARHCELVQAGAELPHWAIHCAPQSATWLGLLGAGGMATVGVGAVISAVVAAVLLLGAPTPKPLAASGARPTSATVPAALLPERADSPTERHIATASAFPPAQIAAGAASPGRAAGQQASAVADDMPRSRYAVSASSRRAADGTAALPNQAPAAPELEVSERATATRIVASSAALADRARSSAVRAERARPSAALVDRARPSDVTEKVVAVTPARREHQVASSRAPAGTRADDPAVDALQEMQEIANAERLLATAPGRALSIVRSVQARFPDGYLREERAYVEVMALLRLGHSGAARTQAEAFLSRYPDGPYSRRVRSAALGSER